MFVVLFFSVNFSPATKMFSRQKKTLPWSQSYDYGIYNYHASVATG
jgi:hypothetical protein